MKRILALLPLTLFGSPAAGGIHERLRLPAQFESHRATYRAAVDRDKETTVAQMEGAGCLRHFWLTVQGIRQNPENGLKLALRIYFDGNPAPAVEMPLAPFFGIHHGHPAQHLDSPYLQVTGRGGFNSYFPMPYKNGMRMTLQNDSPEPIGIWFQADYHRYPAQAFQESLRFHAVYRRVNPAQAYGKPFHLGHGTGSGVLAGATMGMRVFDRTDAWYHCGGETILVDGRLKSAHVLHGIGGEDFFGTAWGQEVFSNGPIGTPYYDENPDAKPGEPRVWFAAYRFFANDPIAFKDSFSFDFGSHANDMSAVLYWYQRGSAEQIVRLPPIEDRLPAARVADGKYDVAPPEGRAWRLCGPFSCAGKAEFDRGEFPEKGMDLSQTQPADFGQYADAVKRKFGPPVLSRWTGPAQAIFNFVDLTPHFRSRMKSNMGFPVDVSAYALTTVQSPAGTSSTLRIGHDDWMRVWHNGKVIYEGAERPGFKTTEIPVRLARGENRFLLKVANRDNSNFRAWVFLFDLAPPAAPVQKRRDGER